ncbi:alcohol dehydrogenase catalytic domain-containing protein [candidate division KSB1 bacterium]|nr:alcohol dehydrogenase catalytic domain-containing protein [candidate division KSB1 bacterium]
MKAAVLSEYGKFIWTEVPTPIISSDDVLVKISYASICGSDQHVFHGEFDGRTHVPFIPGHEFAGQIVEIGASVKGYNMGDRVAVDPIFWCGECPACKLGHFPACRSLKLLGIDTDGGFAEYVAARDFMLFKVDDSIPDTHAALIEVLSIGFHACNRAGLKAGDTVAIFGTGKVGQCILQAVRTKTDQPVFMVDLLENRLHIAERTWADVIPINATRQSPVETIMELTNGRGVDVAFEAIGHAVDIPGALHPIRQCIQSLRPAGTVCVLGLAEQPAPLVMKELIFKEATLRTSRVTHGEFAETIQHLTQGHLRPDALISAIMPGSEAQQAFMLLEQSPEDYLKILLKFA